MIDFLLKNLSVYLLFNIQPISLFLSGEVAPNIEWPDKATIFDVAVSIFAHIQIGSIGTMLTTIIGKG